jgi:hypothetical protein
MTDQTWKQHAYDEAVAENAILRERVRHYKDVLEFYADPESYLAIGFFPDPPCGDFITDWTDTGPLYGFRPGGRARAALADEEFQPMPDEGDE